jgi:hypothetical protein
MSPPLCSKCGLRPRRGTTSYCRNCARVMRRARIIKGHAQFSWRASKNRARASGIDWMHDPGKLNKTVARRLKHGRRALKQQS